MARVLVVEDNLANLKLLVMLLESFGHEVLVAMDGVEGLALVRKERPPLVLMDVDLPGLSGQEVVGLIKQDPELSGVVVVAVTAMAMVGDKERILRAGFDGYLSKPIEPESMQATVEAFLTQSQWRMGQA